MSEYSEDDEIISVLCDEGYCKVCPGKLLYYNCVCHCHNIFEVVRTHG